MNDKTIKMLICAILATLVLSAFAGCGGSTENVSDVQSETSNPFGDSFTPTGPGGTSVSDMTSGLQEPPKYDPTVTC